MGRHDDRDVGIRGGQRGAVIGVEGAVQLSGPPLAGRHVDVDDRHHLGGLERQGRSVEVEHQAASADQEWRNGRSARGGLGTALMGSS